MKPVLSQITRAFCLPWTQYAQWLYWAISSSNFVVNSKHMLKESLIILWWANVMDDGFQYHLHMTYSGFITFPVTHCSPFDVIFDNWHQSMFGILHQCYMQQLHGLSEVQFPGHFQHKNMLNAMLFISRKQFTRTQNYVHLCNHSNHPQSDCLCESLFRLTTQI